MANQKHIEMISLSEDELRKWREQDPKNILDLSDADFTGQTIYQASLNYANLENANFKNAELTNVDLFSATLKGVNFENATINNVNLNNVKDFTGVNFKNTKFLKTEFHSLDLSSLNFENTDFSYAQINFVNFDNSQFKGTIFYESNLATVSFKNARYLNKAKNLLTTKSPRDIKYFEFCDRNIINRFIDWEILRVLGKLPLFGASYLALISIPLFFYILAKFNEHIDIIKLWSSNITSNSPEYIVNLANIISSKLSPVAVPQQSLLLLFSTIFLALGATIYALLCPSRIKEFSRDQWVDQLEKPLLHYWPLAWRFPFARIICILSYLLGGIGIIWVIGGKLIDVGIFIYKYG